MDPLTAARAQMEVSLGFHMIFSALGIALPLFLVIAEGLHLRTRRPEYLALAKKWAKATSLLFAVGAVSGTALSFELGLLWPRFMELAGSVIGGAFALEGYAFFLEAIFLGLYLYGWERLSPRVHLATGVVVAASGALSGALVVAVNAWMQAPGPVVIEGGKIAHASPWAPFLSPVWGAMAFHTVFGSIVAVAFALAGVYAYGILRGRDDAYHRAGLRIAMAIAAAGALVQIASGDVIARRVAETQPAKLAAMEAHFETRAHAPIVVGGIVDERRREVHGALLIPSGLSLLVAHDPAAVVPGLDLVPEDERPPVALVHLSFDVMVAAGSALALVGMLYAAFALLRRPIPRFVFRGLVVASPLGFLAIEAGWVVTEAGRQPFTIAHVLRTRDAVTPEGGVVVTFVLFAVVYAALGGVLIVLLRRLMGRVLPPASPPPSEPATT